MYENTNLETAIRFGVLSVRIVEPNWAYEEFYNHAESIQWNEKIDYKPFGGFVIFGRM